MCVVIMIICLSIVGLSAPVPRGRKGKNKMNKKEQKESEHEMAMAKFDIDPESILKDQGYRRHLHRHANKYESIMYLLSCSFKKFRDDSFQLFN